MMTKKILFALFIFVGTFCALSASSEIPVAYKGRYRPFDAYSRLWLFELSHRDHLVENENTSSAKEMIWRLHFEGFQALSGAPLFYVESPRIQKLLNPHGKQQRFSYAELTASLGKEVLSLPLTLHFKKAYERLSNQSQRLPIVLGELSDELKVTYQNGVIQILSSPKKSPWQAFKEGVSIPIESLSYTRDDQVLSDQVIKIINQMNEFERQTGQRIDSEDLFKKAYEGLIEKRLSAEEVSLALESQYPLQSRLRQAGSTVMALPSKRWAGEWYSLRALKLHAYDPIEEKLFPIKNFTPYSNEDFEAIRLAYIALEDSFLSGKEHSNDLNALEALLASSYETIAGKSYREAYGKSLHYPSRLQLQTEQLYYSYPFIKWCLALYGLAAFILLLDLIVPRKLTFNIGMLLSLSAWLLHTYILVMRLVILERPPVSNMHETVLFVPWVAVLIGFVLNFILKQRIVLFSSTLAAFILLIILSLTKSDSGLENVQAVLDSQYWLVIHVLMVVGSYGLFVLAGVLGHVYLLLAALKKKPSASTEGVGKLIIQSIYIGTALLTTGTILGGVWAAESWGRFWDWDPKESWAFISICVYLLWIHAYRFGKIHYFGLAIGSVIGLMVISFTWYGVNYILGTGFHSYGFGSGGEGLYLAYLALETFFLAFIASKCYKWRPS